MPRLTTINRGRGGERAGTAEANEVATDNGNYRGGEPVTLPHFSEMPTFWAK